MNILSLLTFSIFAAESLISPLTSEYQPPIQTEIAKPDISFSELVIPEVLGEETAIEETPSPTPSPTTTPKPIRRTRKGTMTIALLGDSMMDTLGPNAPHLSQALKKTYPATTFVIKNFGVGGTPIDSGIERIPTIASTNPDVIVLESFAYNVSGTTSQGEVDRHWLNLARAVDAIKNNLPNTKIVIAATIAPNSTRFGDGAPGIAFSQQDKQERTTMIKKYLETTIKFAQSEHTPLANAYHASVDSTGNGKLMYINNGDHIHYSDAGRILMGSKIAQAMIVNKLLE